MVLRTLFYPFISRLFQFGVWFRHQLFDHHLLRSHAVDIPTICVGNLAVGGTGKTPMTAYLVRLLIANGYHPAILSRGYKRKTKGFVMADATSTVDTIGDEAMQMHATFPDLPIAVCENRVKGVKQLMRQVEQLDVIVLDDAMQHRAIRCGFTVLLTAYDNIYISDHMLPWGRLRDIPSRALKADTIVVTKCPDTIRPIDMRVIDNRLHLPTFQSLHFTGIEYAPVTQAGVPLVLCGIAHPEYMLAHVQQQYPQAELIAFPDHHPFAPKDIDAIMEKARHFDFVLTTEKDLQRLRDTDLEARLQAENKQLLPLPIRVRFCSPKENFDRIVLQYVRENKKRK